MVIYFSLVLFSLFVFFEPRVNFKDTLLCFPGSSAGEESACNAGDPGSIPGLGRSTGQGIGYLLQYSGASLVAQLVKNPPAMQETWVRSLGWEDSPGEGKQLPTPVFLPGESPLTEESGRPQSMGSQSQTHSATKYSNMEPVGRG